MNTNGIRTGDRVGAYRGNNLRDTFFGTVTKVTPSGQVTVQPDEQAPGLTSVAVRFTSDGAELGERRFGWCLVDMVDLKERIAVRDGQRAQRKAHHDLLKAVESVSRNGCGEVFPNADWLAKVEAALAAMKALV